MDSAIYKALNPKDRCDTVLAGIRAMRGYDDDQPRKTRHFPHYESHIKSL
jgi:hypothetical protein